ncbi:MAG: ABC transporter permease [Acidobacteriia bacterium]|nr:ABC transporter permease [Terriglobia bacterium]
MAVVLVLLGLAHIGFYETDNLYSIFYAVSLDLPAVIGMQLLLVTGYFDLSVGAIAALAGLTAAIIVAKTDSVLLGLAVALLVAVAAGLINALIVTRLHIHCFVTTIATMGVLHSLALAANDGMVVGGLPDRFAWLARHKVLGLEFPIICSTVFLCLTSYSQYNLLTFRRFYQVGSNPLSATICGLKVKRIVSLAFVFSALGASITGIVGTSRTMAASPIGFETLALDVITACVIGGADLRGGSGTSTGAAIGLLIVQVVTVAVILSGVPLYWRYGSIGIVLIISLIVNRCSNSVQHSSAMRR